MSSSNAFSFLISLLSKPSFFGIKLWMWLLLSLCFVTFAAITVVFLYFLHCRRERSHKSRFHYWPEPKEKAQRTCSLDARLLNISGSLMSQLSGRNSSYRNDVEPSAPRRSIKDAWRSEFSLSEISVATDGLAKESVVAVGDHGTVYRGVLFDGTRVAVKKLLNSFQAEESKAQVEELGHVRHKNLVNLLGYCFEGVHRIVVSEYVDNKSLHYWLHECPEQLSPLTWTVRMNIIHGIARGLAYLHEGVEQGILHRSLKSSNVMLDLHWNPKLSDFGLAVLFSPQWEFILMEALGYMAPSQYASPHTFSAKDDVYCFGILIMEIVTGRNPIDRNRSQPYLVEWLKYKVETENVGEVVDPCLVGTPCSMELKRVLLVALRCVDLNEEHRPDMGDVTHMLEPRDLLLSDDELQYLSPSD